MSEKEGKAIKELRARFARMNECLDVRGIDNTYALRGDGVFLYATNANQIGPYEVLQDYHRISKALRDIESQLSMIYEPLDVLEEAHKHE